MNSGVLELCHAPHSPFTSASAFPRAIRPWLLPDGVHRKFESSRQVATSGASDAISPCFPLGVAEQKPSDLDSLSKEFSAVKARLELVQQKLIRSILNEQDLINRAPQNNFTPNSDSIARAFNFGRKTENISSLQESQSEPTQRNEIRLPQNAQNESLQHEVSTPIRNGCSDMSPFSDADSPAKKVILPEICWATQATEIGLPEKNQNGPLQWQNAHLIYNQHSPFSYCDLSVKATTPLIQTRTLDFPPGLDPVPFSDEYSPIKLMKCRDVLDLKSEERDEFFHGEPLDARPTQNSYIQIDIEQSNNAEAALRVEYDRQHTNNTTGKNSASSQHTAAYDSDESTTPDEQSAQTARSMHISFQKMLMQQLDSIMDQISSSLLDETFDGLLKLSTFLQENDAFIAWNSLSSLCSDLLRLISEPFSAGSVIGDKTSVLDVACDCIKQLCQKSPIVLIHARMLQAVPLILQLLWTHNENLRNSACRALIVLTNSSPELKLVLLNHEATRDVLLQQLSSFDDDLKGARGSYRVLISGTVSQSCSAQLLQ